MNMKKKVLLMVFSILSLLGIFISCAFFLNIRFMPMSITGFVGGSADRSLDKKLSDTYDISFLFDNSSMGTGKIMLPNYCSGDVVNPQDYAELFQFHGQPEETLDFFLYKTPESTLKIYKNLNYICYEKNVSYRKNSETKIQSIQDETIIQIAKDFFSNRSLDNEYIKASVRFDQNHYTVLFIKELFGYEDYAFPNKAILDSKGNIVSVEYYFFDYEKVDTVNLKPMKSAFYELPLDATKGSRIDLNQCSVVYIFDDSIIQPAYLFEGQTVHGNTFQCFVKAAKYD